MRKLLTILSVLMFTSHAYAQITKEEALEGFIQERADDGKPLPDSISRVADALKAEKLTRIKITGKLARDSSNFSIEKIVICYNGKPEQVVNFSTLITSNIVPVNLDSFDATVQDVANSLFSTTRSFETCSKVYLGESGRDSYRALMKLIAAKCLRAWTSGRPVCEATFATKLGFSY